MIAALSILGVVFWVWAIDAIINDDDDDTSSDDEVAAEDENESNKSGEDDLLMDLDDEKGDDTSEGGEGSDTMNGSESEDTTNGGEGEDTVPAPEPDEIFVGTEDDETLTGTEGDDSIVAKAGADVLLGGEGDDSMRGGDGEDTLLGNEGDDSLVGGDDDDLLVGGEGSDVMNGRGGDDTIDGTSLLDQDALLASMQTATGPDDFVFEFSDEEDTDEGDDINGGIGDDLIVMGSEDSVFGGDGADIFSGGWWIRDGEPAIIEDYKSDEDFLTYTYEGTTEPEITTDVDDATGDATVFADGQEVIVVINAGPSFDASNITLLQA